MDRDEIRDLIAPSASLRAIIRLRPLALETFYRRKLDPWPQLDESLGSACARAGLPALRIEEEIGMLPVPPRDSPWLNLPAAYLIDFLTDEHRMFLSADLSAIRHILEKRQHENKELPAEEFPIRKAFAVFAAKFAEHVSDEEARIFPAILEAEYLAAHPERASRRPGFTLPPDALTLREEWFAAAMKDWSAAVDGVEGEGASCPPTLGAACDLIRELNRNIREHARLESECLRPMARAIQASLEAALKDAGSALTA
jgi:iron-sulfur cluster repair protein YtfE (RIC family)